MTQLKLWEQHDEEDIVVKANELIMGQIDWTVWEYRIFLAHVAQLRRDDTEFKLQRVQLKEIQKDISGRTNRLYEIGEEAADRMSKKQIRVKQKGKSGKDRYSVFNVYSSCHYENGVVEGRFTKEMKPLLLQLKERGYFTMYLKRRALTLDSLYAVRFYEIVKRYEHQGSFRISVEELRGIFNLKDKYKRFRDLRRRVIDQAKKELDEHCDVTFEYEVEREGRTPVAVRFRVRPNVDVLPDNTSRDDAGDDTRDERASVPPPRPERVTNGSREEQYFDRLDEATQKKLWSRAQKLAKERDPGLKGQVFRAETWRCLFRVIKNEYLTGAPSGA